MSSVNQHLFIFDGYDFDSETGEATFRYGYGDGRTFEERVRFAPAAGEYDAAALDAALRLAFLVAGTSYIKTFLAGEVQLPFAIDTWTANFLNQVYQEGLSQYAFENDLTRADLPQFVANGEAHHVSASPAYKGDGILVLESGGKDSLLTSVLLKKAGRSFTPWYVRSGEEHPAVLDTFDEPLQTAQRIIDIAALRSAADDGAKNGHVPVTYIVQSYALIQAVLLGKNTILSSIAHEGEEPHATIGDLSITHQWSKTWYAEQLFAEYVRRYVSPAIAIGSPLRQYSEVRVAQLFAEHAWHEYGHQFSSCNRANYQQGAQNSQLTWCGECPKCANSYLLFAPYVQPDELRSLFNGKDLFEDPALEDTFKGLLGVDDEMKPFECIGEVDELRFAYHKAQKEGGYAPLRFTVPPEAFDETHEYPAQANLNNLFKAV